IDQKRPPRVAFRLLRESGTLKTEAAFLMTECKTEQYKFHALGSREVVGHFDGGDITSDAGGLLLREVEKRTGIIRGFAACFQDRRDPRFTEFTVEELVAQRIYGLDLGYEDLNDHDQLRSDPALAVMVGKEDVKGEKRRLEQDRGKALAGKSTLNRLELTAAGPFSSDPYKKIGRDDAAIDRLFVDHFLESHEKPPLQIILDADATDDPIHGHQEGRFYHGYYDCYCYLPLYIFCGEFLLCARLRRADIDASAGTVEELKRIVAQIRQKWPKVRIVLRGDSGFCREEILSWCESNGVDYVIGLAKNDVVIREIKKELEKAHQKFEKTGKARAHLQGFPVPHEGQLEPQATRHCQSGAFGKRIQSTVCRDIVAETTDGSPVYLRAHVLCARRYGEPDQRATVGTLRRPHQHRDDARQPASALLFIGRLSADARLAPVRIEGYRVGSCPMRHDSFEAAQDWRTDSGHCAPGSGFAWPVVIPTRRSSHRVYTNLQSLPLRY